MSARASAVATLVLGLAFGIGAARAGGQLHAVTVGNNFFSPQSISVAPGDTVRWTNVSGHDHNVVSCTPQQTGCDGATAAESFSSGAAGGFWVYEYTFTVVGSNLYVCQPHAAFMTGTVEVVGATTPPAVPAGAPGMPMTVRKLAADGSSLAVLWDATTCAGGADHQIVHGTRAGLPAAPGGPFALAGARCAIGSTSPHDWVGVPGVGAGGGDFLWWLVLATDGGSTEGSWGADGAGAERVGPGPGGSSNLCGISAKSLANGCGTVATSP